MVLGVVLKLFGEGSLSSMSMFQLVDETGRRGHKISKVRVEGIINKGNENIWAETWCRGAMGSVLMMYDGSRGLKGIKFTHPCGGFGMFVSENIRYLRLRVRADAFAGSTCKAVAHRVVKEAVGVEVWTCSRVES